MSNKQDLRDCNSGELSLWVMNDEGLYRMRRNRAHLLEVLNDLFIYLFIYSAEQLAELKQDLDADEREDDL